MTYLNQAGTSWPPPAPVREAVARALATEPDAWADELDAAHREVAAAFGVADPARLLLTPGCTSALAVGIADHPWERGDRIAISGFEHHALHRPASKLVELGVEVVVVPPAPDGPVALDALEAELEHGARLVAMTAACNVTGELLPIDDVVRLAHGHGALCLIDAAQVAGWWPLDLARLGADLVAFAGHKGLQAPWGIGGLYVAPHVATTSPAATCELPAAGSTTACAPMPGHCDVGSVDRAALAGLAAALRWLAEPERAERLAEGRARIARIAAAARELPGVTLHGAADPEARLPTLALTVAGRRAGELAAGVAARGVVAAGGLQCAPLAHETLGTAPHGVLRLSAGPTNVDDDVEHAIDALSAVVGAGLERAGVPTHESGGSSGGARRADRLVTGP